jgi:hypothetical protein
MPTMSVEDIYERLAGASVELAERDPSTAHLLSLRERKCSAQDDNFLDSMRFVL